MSRAEQPHGDDFPAATSADPPAEPTPGDPAPAHQHATHDTAQDPTHNAAHDTASHPADTADTAHEPTHLSTRDLTRGPVRDSSRSTVTSAGIVRRTRISGTWVAVVVAAVVLVFLLVFILQNQAGVTVRFLGAEGTMPLGVAMLFAAIAGALLVALIGTARILQLRRRVRRSNR